MADLNTFKHLSTLNLSKNNIKRVLGTSSNTLNLPNLKVLNLSWNNLQLFDFPSLPHLEILYLNENDIEFLKNLSKSESPYLK